MASGPGHAPKAPEARSDAVAFFRTWPRHPAKLGAVAPSSARHCRRMADLSSTYIDGPVLELGPGLGAVTQALIDKGVAPERITSIEFDPGFAATLKRRFPAVNVVEGDGLFGLGDTLGERANERFAAILFAIPVAGMPQSERQALFADYFTRLLPGANLTQLSYLQFAPVKPVADRFTVRASPMVWANIPPARVWAYEEADATTGAAA